MTSKTARRLAAGLALLSVSALAESPRVQFINVTREAGITFSHENGASAGNRVVKLDEANARP